MNTVTCQRCGISITCLPGESGPIAWLYRHWINHHFERLREIRNS